MAKKRGMYPPPEQLQTQTSAHPVIRLPAKPNIRSTEQLHTRTSAQPHLRTPINPEKSCVLKLPPT